MNVGSGRSAPAATAVKGKDVVISVDIGSSSTRCSVFSCGEHGQLQYHPQCSAKIEFNVLTGQAVPSVHDGAHNAGATGRKESNESPPIPMVQRLARTVDTAMEQVAASLRAGGARSVVGVGFACFAMSMVGVRTDGTPVTPLFTYAGSAASTAGNDDDKDARGGGSCTSNYEARLAMLLQPPAGVIRKATHDTVDEDVREEGNCVAGSDGYAGLTGDPCQNEVSLHNAMRSSIARLIRAHHRRTGTLYFHQSYLLSQLLRWPGLERACATRDIHHWLSLPSFIVSQWCSGSTDALDAGAIQANEPVQSPACCPVSYSEASWTGLLNHTLLDWSFEETLGEMEGICSSGRGNAATVEADSERAAVAEGSVSGSASDRRDVGKCAQLLSLLRRTLGNTPLCDPQESPENFRLLQCIADRWNGGTSGSNCTLFSPAHTKLFLGLGDGAAANLGNTSNVVPSARTRGNLTSTEGDQRVRLIDEEVLGAYQPTITIGTSAAARVLLPRSDAHASPSRAVVYPCGLFCYILTRHYRLVGGALTDGGNLIEWFKDSILEAGKTPSAQDQGNAEREKAFAGLMQELHAEVASRSTPKCAPPPVPIVLPFWSASGERATGYNAAAVGIIAHLRRETTAKHILQGLFEGVSFRLLEVMRLLHKCIEQLRKHGGSADREADLLVVCSGGALDNNAYWCRLLASVLSMVCNSDATGSTLDSSSHKRKQGCSLVQLDAAKFGESTSRGVAKLMWHWLSTHDACTTQDVRQGTSNPSTGFGCEGMVTELFLDDLHSDQKMQLWQRKKMHDVLYEKMQ